MWPWSWPKTSKTKLPRGLVVSTPHCLTLLGAFLNFKIFLASSGKFLYFKTDRAELISRTLITKELTQAEEWRCLTFWYFIGEEKRTHTNEKVVELNVSALHPDNSSDVTTLWSTSYRTNRWTYVQLPLHHSESPFKVNIKKYKHLLPQSNLGRNSTAFENFSQSFPSRKVTQGQISLVSQIRFFLVFVLITDLV